MFFSLVALKGTDVEFRLTVSPGTQEYEAWIIGLKRKCELLRDEDLSLRLMTYAHHLKVI